MAALRIRGQPPGKRYRHIHTEYGRLWRYVEWDGGRLHHVLRLLAYLLVCVLFVRFDKGGHFLDNI